MTDADRLARGYAHICRDNHVQIGHNDSDHEQCPVCRERNRADHAEVQLAAERQARETLEQAAKALVVKLDAAIPALDGICVLASVHGMGYQGAKFGVELEALRALLPEKTP